MSKRFILYNPLSSGGQCSAAASSLKAEYGDGAELRDITAIGDYGEFFSGLGAGDSVIVCGGDGTLHHFVNDMAGIDPACDIYFYAAGSGNDFLRDIGRSRKDGPVLINEYIRDLPVAIVNGEERRFLNGLGCGLDGYVCREFDRLKALKGHANYTAIALKALLFSFRPRSAVITVDGKEYRFDDVWLSATMFGRYFGSGMKVAPRQDRTALPRQVTVMIFHCPSRLKTLMTFPKFLQGSHEGSEGVVILTGTEVTVSYEQTATAQVDGETVSDVTGYCVKVKQPEKAL